MSGVWAAGGRVVGLDEPFGEGIDGPPSHPNCRCWCVPAPVKNAAEVLGAATANPAEGIGITYSVYTGDVARTGLAFSPYKDTERVVPFGDPSALMDEFDSYWRERGDLLRSRQGAVRGNHFGLWYNSEDGNYYLDVSVVRPRGSIREVIRQAAEADQIAFFDLGSKTEINTAAALAVLGRLPDASDKVLFEALGIAGG